MFIITIKVDACEESAFLFLENFVDQQEYLQFEIITFKMVILNDIVNLGKFKSLAYSGVTL